MNINNNRRKSIILLIGFLLFSNPSMIEASSKQTFIPMDTMFKEKATQEAIESSNSLSDLLEYYEHLKQAGSWTPDGRKFEPSKDSNKPTAKPIDGTTSKDEIFKKIYSDLQKEIGKKYFWGGVGPNSFDCSGLVFSIYKKYFPAIIPRTSKSQANVGTTIHFDKLKEGDLVFFNTKAKTGQISKTIQNSKTGTYLTSTNITHVGIYVGSGKMIHAGTSTGVKEVDLNSGYYRERFIKGQRVY